MKRRSFEQADHIRLKLDWLDKHFQPQVPLHEKIVSRTPILPLAIILIAGITFANYSSPATSFRLSAGLIVISVMLLITAFQLTSSKCLWAVMFSVMLLFFALGTVRLSNLQYRSPDHISRLLQNERKLVTIRGTVISPIFKNTAGDSFSSVPWLSTQCSFNLEASAVQSSEIWHNISGKVRVQVTDAVDDIRQGNEVEIFCWLDGFRSPANPGQFDVPTYMHRRGIYVAASAPLKESIVIINNSKSFFQQLRAILYRFADNSLLDETMTDSDILSLSAALLLGQRADLNPVINSAFRKTGLAHFISLSGMHVAILAGSLWWLLRTLQIPKRPRAGLCIILIIIYALIVPARAPTMRAVFLSSFFFSSMFIHRQVNPLNTLALSSIVLLFVRPYELFSAGWQLSFLSVLGIILFYHTIHYYLQDRFFYPVIFLFNGRYIRLQHCLYRITEMLAVGFAAWLTVSPILLFYFGQINPLSPVWTVIILPVVTIVLYAGFLKIAFATLLPTIGTLLGIVLNLSGQLLKIMVKSFAKVDIFLIKTHQLHLSVIVLIYGLLLALCLIPYKRRQLRKCCVILLFLCCLQPFLSDISRRFNHHVLEITCLSVGHGQAIVVSAPDSEYCLFDAGSITYQNLSQKCIYPYLQKRGIFHLDTVWLSHGDLDHINAVPYLASSIPIDHLYANPTFIQNTQKSSLEKQFNELLNELSLKIEPVSDYTGKNLSIHNLWPDEETTTDPSISENDKSQVLLIEYADRKILLCGDIEIYAQERFLKLYPDLDVDVMVLPHHGSTINLNNRFIEQLDPSSIIASCSRRNTPGAFHPTNDSKIQAFYTSIDGAVTIRVKADGTLSVDGFLHSNNQ